MICAIDPGLKHCGVAVFDDFEGGLTGKKNGALIWAGLVRSKHPEPGSAESLRAMSTLVHERIWIRKLDYHLVIEMPKVYPAARQQGDQNDLMRLAAMVGALTAGIPWRSVRHVEPRAWKGTIKADDMTERIKGRLDVDETPLVDLTAPKSLHHNIWDAVGIGLWACGRLAPHKEYPR